MQFKLTMIGSNYNDDTRIAIAIILETQLLEISNRNTNRLIV